MLDIDELEITELDEVDCGKPLVENHKGTFFDYYCLKTEDFEDVPF